MTPAARQRLIWWHVAIAYVLVLYATLPLGRPVITYAREHLAQWQNLIVNGVFAASGIALLAYLASRWRSLSPLAYVCFAVFIRLYWHECQTIITYPEERLHFIEYGVLAIILHRAVSIDLPGVWAYLAAMLLGAVIGLGDECVQYLTKYLPITYRRYFGWGDVWLNALGVLYGLGFLATVLRNKRAPLG